VLTWKIQEPLAAGDVCPTDPPNTTSSSASDLNGCNNTASVLLRDAPKGDFVVETAVKLNVPDSPECCYNYAQGGVLVYQDDDNFVKLTNTSIWNTRQTEWAKEIYPVPEGWNRYGNTVVGPPSDFGQWTYLRIVAESCPGPSAAPPAGTPTATPHTPARTERPGCAAGRGPTPWPISRSRWSPWAWHPVSTSTVTTPWSMTTSACTG
jgi:arabinan endo-1,5-alpha-L-arabinosidase